MYAPSTQTWLPSPDGAGRVYNPRRLFEPFNRKSTNPSKRSRNSQLLEHPTMQSDEHSTGFTHVIA